MRLGTARFSDVGRPFALSFLPDGKSLAVTSWDGTISVWDLETRKLLSEWNSEAGAERALAISPDGTTLATAGRTLGIRLWQKATGKQVQTLAGHKLQIDLLAYSPDGKYLVSAGRKNVRLWDLTSGQPIFNSNRFGVPTFLADGSTLAIACRDGGPAPEGKAYILTVDVQTAKETKRQTLPLDSVPLEYLAEETFSLSSSGRWFVYAEQGLHAEWNWAMRVTDLLAKRQKQIHKSEKGQFNQSTPEYLIAPDERCLALVAKSGQELLLLELATGQVRCRFPRPEGGKASIAFSPDGRWLACGSVDRTVLLLDLTGRMVDGKIRFVHLSTKDLARLWEELDAADGMTLNRAIWELVAGAEDAIPYLSKRLHTKRHADAMRVSELIGELNSDTFQVRTKAARALEDLHDTTEPALRKKIAEPLPLETLRRIEQLLEKIDQWWDKQQRQVRAVAVLEYIATPDAREALRALSRNDFSPRLAEEAKTSLRRLK